MKIKETLVSLLVASVMTLPGYAQDIGDSMPNHEGNSIVSDKRFGKNNRVVSGYHSHKDGKCFRTLAHRVCEVEDKKPYAVYDFKTNILYLDKDVDGIIDEMIKDLPYGHSIIEDRPPCD